MSVFGAAALKSLGQSIGSIASGTAGGIIGAITQRRQAKRNFKYQQQLNEQVFQHNQKLAEQQNQMNIEQWNRENEYNSPLAQAQRLQAAGLNPDLVAQGLGGISAQSPMLTAGTPYPTTDVASLQNAATNTASTIVGGATSMAQTASNIQGQDSITNYFNSVREIRQQLEKGQLQAQGVELELMNFQLKELKPLEKRKVIKECQLLETQAAHFDQVIKESQSKISLLDAQVKAQLLDNLFNSSTMADRIEKVGMEYAKLVFETDIKQKEAQHMGAYLLAQIWNLNTSAALNDTKNDIAKVEKDIAEKTKGNKIKYIDGKLEFDIEYNKIRRDNGELTFYLDTGIELIDGLTGAANIWKSLLGNPKKKPKHTTSRTEKSDGTWTQTDTYDN